MMTSKEILAYVRAEPFRAFQIHMASGRTFDIRHPEMVRVGKNDLVIEPVDGVLANVRVSGGSR